MNLPGWPVEPWQVHPRLRRLGYELREDCDLCYLTYGGEEVVAVLDARVATVPVLNAAINNDIADKLREADTLHRVPGLEGLKGR